jgi:exonuclease III
MLYSNCAPDVICLQETWQIPNSNLLSLPNYFPLEYLTRRNSLQGGGVGMYLKESVQYTVLKEKSIMFDKIYESLFVEVITSNKKKCLIGSIYRPGNHSNMTQSDQFGQYMVTLTLTCLSITLQPKLLNTLICCFLLAFYRLSPSPRGSLTPQPH